MHNEVDLPAQQAGLEVVRPQRGAALGEGVQVGGFVAVAGLGGGGVDAGRGEGGGGGLQEGGDEGGLGEGEGGGAGADAEGAGWGLGGGGGGAGRSHLWGGVGWLEDGGMVRGGAWGRIGRRLCV